MMREEKILNRYYTVKQAAALLGVTPLTMRNWDNSGKLRARRNPLNNYRIYKAEEIELLLRTMERSWMTKDIL